MYTTFKHTDISDLSCIQELACRTVDKSYRYFLGDLMVDNYLSRDSLNNYLQNNINNFWGLYIEQDIVGFAICIDNIIDFMMIDVDFHNRGLGTILLQYCESMLFENHQVIALESYEKNTKARSFYEANNWILTEKYKDTKQGAVKLIFRKRLNAEEELLRNTVSHLCSKL